jgi:NADH-quinone oxidoreductase subunit E
VKRIDGTEVPLLTPWVGKDGKVAGREAENAPPAPAPTPKPAVKQAEEAKKKAKAKDKSVEAEKPEVKAKPAKKADGKAETKAPKAAKVKAKDKAPAKAKKAPAAKATAPSTPDDLKLLKGVGPALEKKLHSNGVTTFAQIAAWGSAEITDMDDKLLFKGRIERDNWVEQAKQLAEGDDTEFSQRAKKGDVY